MAVLNSLDEGLQLGVRRRGLAELALCLSFESGLLEFILLPPSLVLVVDKDTF